MIALYPLDPHAESYDYAILHDDDNAGTKSHKETLIEKDVDEDRIVLVSNGLDNADEDAPVEMEDMFPAEISARSSRSSTPAT